VEDIRSVSITTTSLTENQDRPNDLTVSSDDRRGPRMTVIRVDEDNSSAVDDVMYPLASCWQCNNDVCIICILDRQASLGERIFRGRRRNHVGADRKDMCDAAVFHRSSAPSDVNTKEGQ
jgi:hypothetical protein